MRSIGIRKIEEAVLLADAIADEFDGWGKGSELVVAERILDRLNKRSAGVALLDLLSECICTRYEGHLAEVVGCPVHGGRIDNCDDDFCDALKKPSTPEELRAALEHWESHGWLSGCSHGC